MSVDDTAYDATVWDGVTSVAPSKNAVRDKLVALEASLPGTYVVQGGANTNALNTLIGNRTTHGGVGAQYGLEVPVNFVDSNATITQAFSAYAFFSGDMGPDQGAMQGGGTSVRALVNQAETCWALGDEGIASVSGTGSLPLAIGLQSTAFVEGTVTVTDLISFSASAPRADSGTPTVTNAYSVKILEPTVGTNRYSLFSKGRHRLQKGTHSNVLEMSNASNLLQWSCDGTVLRGYASDGAATRITLDPRDDATERATFQPQGAATRGVTINHLNSSPTANLFQVQIQGTSKVAVLNTGQLLVNSALLCTDGTNIQMGTTSGTKIGTTTTQKLGFYNATPVAQGASVADATDAASAITQLNALISRIEALGLIATI